MKLTVLADRYAVCRLEPGAPVPGWAEAGPFVSVTRTRDELSIVCLQDAVPAGVQVESDFRVLKVEGPLDFSLTGLLANLSGALAEAKISLFALSTFDTDYILVRDGDLIRARVALGRAGHTING
jgi:hypothetical protein